VNTKILGNIGVGQAIAYYTANKNIISMPLNDSQSYDLIVDSGTSLLKVQVKTTTQKGASGYYEVDLRSTGGNKSRTTAKNFDKTESDIVFVLQGDGALFEIPSKEIQVVAKLTLNQSCEKYRVQNNIPFV